MSANAQREIADLISPDIQIEGFEARHISLLADLVRPSDTQPTVLVDERSDVFGALVIVRDESGRTVAAFHSQRGPIEGMVVASNPDLPALAREANASRVFVVQQGALESLADTIAARVTREDGYAGQWLVALLAIREHLDAGRILAWPRPLASAPIPTVWAVSRAFDLVLPEGRSLLVCAWDGGRLATGFALRRGPTGIDRIVGPERLQKWTGYLSGDFRRDQRFITDEVARRLAPVHTGLFAEIRSLRGLLESGDRGAWARAVLTQDIIISPMTAYVGVALGLDAAALGADRLGAWARASEATSWLTPVVRYVRSRVREVASVTDTLGFNPLKLLADAIARRPPTDRNESER